MNNKIRLVVVLMTLCVMTLIGLQCFWSYQSYQNAERVFKSDVNDALANAVNRSMGVHRQKLANQYREWVSDTNLVVIGIRYMDKYNRNQFTLQDKNPIEQRGPFTISFSDFSKQKGEKINPASRLFFIDKMMGHINDDLQTGSLFYHTARLYNLLDSALIKEKVGLKELEVAYTQELAKRNINEPFQLASSKASLEPAELPTKVAYDKYTTRQFLYGFRDQKNVSAIFINPSLILLSKIKWALITSMLLIVVTITCFVYTVKTLLSQKKLAQLKDDFVNNMTHELKTPVSTISIAAEAIQNFDIGKKASGEYLEIIRYQAAALATFIDQVLERMLNYQPGVSLEHKLVNVNSVIQNSIKQCRPLLDSKNAQVNLNLSGEHMNIEGDAIHIGNVLVNLIDNAIKYGSIPPDIMIEMKKDINSVSISVSNKGDIIPIEYQNKIFDRFFRIPSGNLHNVKGYGLGLSYARDIVQQHNGILTLDNTQEKTTFKIILPIVKA